MNRSTSITLVAVLLVAAVAVPLTAATVAPNGASQDGTDDEAGNDSIAPGERFAAAVGVQNAELEGDVSERAFGVRLANAETNETKAAVLAAEVTESERRLAELEERLVELNESREAGEISDGRYRAAVATTVAEMRGIERQAAVAETAAADLPERALADHRVDDEAIGQLRARAGDLGGPEAAAVARSIAGDDVGRSVGAERGPDAPAGTIGPGDRPGADAANATDAN